jgi:hypothetical protein
MMSEHSLLSPAKLAQTSTRRERRVWARQATSVDSVCQPVAAETALEAETGWPAEIVEISRGGIGLRLERRFEPATPLIIELPTTSEEPSRLLGVRVIHATLYTDGRWYHGCKFLVELSEEDMRTLL